MKTKILIFTALFSTCLFSQSKFSMGLSLGELSLKKDLGTSYEGFVSYNLDKNIALNFVGSFSKMKSKQLDVDYQIDKYALLVSYDFGKTEKSKFESIFGFSYLRIDEKLLPEDNKGLGVDLGFQVTFNLKSKLNYGMKLISTYSNIAPGGLINGGAYIKYNL
jgi:hypothetical protein